MRFTQTQVDENGSIPLTLLVAIILGGVIAVLFASVNTGVATSRNDRDFAQAIQIADAGIQDAYVNLLAASVLLEDDPDAELDAPCVTPKAGVVSTIESGTCVAEVGAESSYEWDYTREGDSRSWVVDARGSYRDSTRQVRSTIGHQPLIESAILAETDISYNGGPGDPEPFPIGLGGKMKFTSPQSAAAVNELTVYRLDGDHPDSEYGSFPQDQIVYAGETLVLKDMAAEAFDTGVCRTGAGGIAEITSIPRTLVRGTTYCVTDFNVSNPGANLTLSGPVQDGPVKVYVRGDVRIQSKDANADRPAADLQIYSSGTSMRRSGNSTVSALIWAPNAHCRSDGGGSGYFAGAMACKSVALNGRWDYDASVGKIEGTTFQVGKWTEQRVGAAASP